MIEANEGSINELSLEEVRYDVLLTKLHLVNFRCFTDLVIKLEYENKPKEKKHPLTVIIAENGGGKTAILEAIVGILKNLLAELSLDVYPKVIPVPKKDRKILAGNKSSKISKVEANVLIEYLIDKEFEKSEETEEGEEELVINKELIPHLQKTTLIYTSGADYKYPFEEVPLSLPSLPKDINLPVLVYFGGETVKIEYKEDLPKSPSRLNLIYQNALEGDRFAYTHFYNWWKSNEDRMLRMKKESREYENIANQFRKIQTAVEYLMNDEVSKPTYKNLRINEHLKMGIYKITYDKDKEITRDFIEVSQFSSGEKSLFAYIADLGLRLLHANPMETSAEEVGLHVFKGRGVALIDEIGLHLHPKWQQKVIGKLLEIFPDMQFVVTTHSPLILGGLSSKVIRVIDNQKVYRPEETYGREVDDVLEIVMKVEAGIFTKAIQKIAAGIAENELEEAEKLIKLLKNKINEMGDDGEHHPDILRMNILLNRKKLIGR